MRAGRAVLVSALLLAAFLLVAGCEERHGFLKIDSDVLFHDTDRLSCGEAKIVPQGDGLLDAFVTLKPQDCALTLHRSGDFLGLGTELCTLHIGDNRITTVYLSGTRASLSCVSSGA